MNPTFCRPFDVEVSGYGRTNAEHVWLQKDGEEKYQVEQGQGNVYSVGRADSNGYAGGSAILLDDSGRRKRLRLELVWPETADKNVQKVDNDAVTVHQFVV